MKIETMVLGCVQTNCYILYNDKAEAVIIDPADRGTRILDFLQSKGLQLKAILLTHGHFDHIMAVNELRAATGAACYASKEEEGLLCDVKKNCSLMIRREYSVKPDVLLSDSQELELLGEKIKVIASPGHTAGSVCYYFEDQTALFSGDTLFYESVGRTDLPTGDSGKLRTSVNRLLTFLPEPVRVYPGHGPETDIGHEKQANPFLDGGYYND